MGKKLLKKKLHRNRFQYEISRFQSQLPSRVSPLDHGDSPRIIILYFIHVNPNEPQIHIYTAGFDLSVTDNKTFISAFYVICKCLVISIVQLWMI